MESLSLRLKMDNKIMGDTVDYGQDALGIRNAMIGLGIAGVFILIGCTFAFRIWDVIPVYVIRLVQMIGAIFFLYGAWMASYMTWSSRVGKLKTRDMLLSRADRIRPWQGNGIVVDVGCGRGLMLIGAAKRLDSGKAIGFDLWRAEDQSDNSRESALSNASKERVADRVTVETGDAQDLPLSSQSVDIVTSHWVIHNLENASDRSKALDEMWRVLRPGGVIVLADINHVKTYVEHFMALGAVECEFLNGGKEAAIMGLLSGGTYRPQFLICSKRLE